MNQVRLIAGKVQGSTAVRYWKVEDVNVDTHIGNYAIVENLNGYTMVEILGLVVTTKEKAGNFSFTSYEKMKKMIKEVDLEELMRLSGKEIEGIGE